MKSTDEHLNELIEWGGGWMPRGYVIQELTVIARSSDHPHPKRLVDAWFWGYETRKRLEAQRGAS